MAPEAASTVPTLSPALRNSSNAFSYSSRLSRGVSCAWLAAAQ